MEGEEKERGTKGGGRTSVLFASGTHLSPAHHSCSTATLEMDLNWDQNTNFVVVVFGGAKASFIKPDMISLSAHLL